MSPTTSTDGRFSTGRKARTLDAMQMDEAARLRNDWEAKGSPPCDHPSIVKEYWQGSDTGDKVCQTCGELFYPGKPEPTKR